MKRSAEKDLIAWKNSRHRLPLILRGARQVGKTTLVEQFGAAHFDNVLKVNLEENPLLTTAFERLDPQQIISKLEIMTKSKIIPGKTLLFFDEIQECPAAITSLRYFKEKLPELHVIGAGSLLEFTLNSEDFSFPVGRVQFLHLTPFSFSEYLTALKHTKLLAVLGEASLDNPLPDSIHQHTLTLLRQYFLTGGMPAVIQAWIDDTSLLTCQHLQTALLQAYENDFGKYARQAQIKYLRCFYERAPYVIGDRFKFRAIDPDIRSRELKLSLEQLCHAGLLTQIFATSGSGLPLAAQATLKKFKLLFLDIGLLQRALRVEGQEILDANLMLVNEGALAEQFVGQELIAYADRHETPRLHYWDREKRGSEAEIDFLISIGSHVLPIEVKAGKTGRLRSLYQFLEEKKAPLGVRISQRPLELKGRILSVPLYMIHELPRLCKDLLKEKSQDR